MANFANQTRNNADKTQFTHSPSERDSTVNLTEAGSLNRLDAYIQAGWHLVPIPGGSKGPAGKGWNQPESPDNPEGYTRNLERILRHFEQGGNLGLATLPSRIAVLDIDDLPKSRRFFEDHGHGQDFESLLADDSNLHIRSGRPGRDKILFRVTDGFNLHTCNKSQSVGFELRYQSRAGTTTQDVLPPSIHPDTGKPYQWKGSLEDIHSLPYWLEQVWMELEHGGTKTPRGTNYQEKTEKETLTRFERAMLTHALKSIPSEDYDTWVKVGLALKNSLSDSGLDIWLDWSRMTTAGNFCQDACENKWHQALEGEVPVQVTLGSIFFMAEQNGWSKKVFVESQLKYLLEVIKRKSPEEITSDEFLAYLSAAQTHTPVLWERDICQALAEAKLKSQVTKLLKALLKENRCSHAVRGPSDDQEGILREENHGLEEIRLDPVRMHEILPATLEILAKTGAFFRQGPAICKLFEKPGGLEIFTFSQGVEIRPELLKYACWLKRNDAGAWYRGAPGITFANELRALPNKSMLNELSAISRQPFYRPDMTLSRQTGYDEQTRIYGDFDPDKFNIPATPTKEDAKSAAEELRQLFQESGLETKHDHSAALALLLTAAIRPSLEVAPFFLMNAKDPGAGKKYLGDLACLLASPEPPMPLVLKKDQNEVGKAVFSVLLKGEPMVVFDEVETANDGTLDLPKPLLTIATSSVYQDRVLTTSQTAICSTRVLMMLMGNNVHPTQDSVRRLIQINFAGHDVVEGVKSYTRDPKAEMERDRERFVGLAFTVIQAWITAGKPPSGLPKLPTYGDWCQLVREPILWLGYPDPAHNTLVALKQDDHALNLMDLFAAWYEVHKSIPVSAGQLLRGLTHTVEGEDDHPLYVAIKELMPHKNGEDITQQLGYFLKRQVGVIRNGLILRKAVRNPNSTAKVGNRYYIEKVGPGAAANDDLHGEEII